MFSCCLSEGCVKPCVPVLCVLCLPVSFLPSGTREAAYIHAITAAGVSFAVTKGCSRGELPGCGCDQSRTGEAGNFQWAGCSDNVMFGSAFSKQFTDARERLKNSNGRAMMNLHNNQAGREVRARIRFV